MFAAYPAGQVAPTPPATPPVTPPTADVRVGENGYIHGIDGMLDQISGALVRQALPIIQRDKDLQVTVGGAIGTSAGRVLAQPLWIIAGIAAVYVGWQIFKPHTRENPRRNPRRSRR